MLVELLRMARRLESHLVSGGFKDKITLVDLLWHVKSLSSHSKLDPRGDDSRRADVDSDNFASHERTSQQRYSTAYSTNQ